MPLMPAAVVILLQPPGAAAAILFILVGRPRSFRPRPRSRFRPPSLPISSFSSCCFVGFLSAGRSRQAVSLPSFLFFALPPLIIYGRALAAATIPTRYKPTRPAPTSQPLLGNQCLAAATMAHSSGGGLQRRRRGWLLERHIRHLVLNEERCRPTSTTASPKLRRPRGLEEDLSGP